MNLSHPHIRYLLTFVAFAALVFFVFGKSLRSDFTVWDDDTIFYKHPKVATGAEDKGLIKSFWLAPDPQILRYIPLPHSIWSLTARSSGWSKSWKKDKETRLLYSRYCHTLNLITHWLTGCLVFFIVLHILQQKQNRLEKNTYWISALVTAFYLLHPLQADVVCWASGFKDTLGGFLALLAWVLHLKGTDFYYKKKQYTTAITLWVLAGLFFTLSCTAQMSPGMPLAIVACDLFFFRRRWTTATLPLLWLIPAAIIGIATKTIEKTGYLIYQFESPELWAKPLIALDSLGFYLKKLTFPFKLLIEYDHSWQKVIADAPTNEMIIGSFFIIFIIIELWRRKRLTAPLLFIIFFTIALAPMSGLVDHLLLMKSTVANRYLYVPIVFLTIATALWLRRLNPQIFITFSLIIIAFWAILSFFHQRHFRDAIAMSEYMLLHRDENADLWYNHGVALAENKLNRRAVSSYKKAIEIDPAHYQANYILASFYAQIGNRQQSLQHLLAIENSPRADSRLYLSISRTYRALGDLDKSAIYRKLNDRFLLRNKNKPSSN